MGPSKRLTGGRRGGRIASSIDISIIEQLMSNWKSGPLPLQHRLHRPHAVPRQALLAIAALGGLTLLADPLDIRGQSTGPAGSAVALDEAVRQHVIEAAGSNLREHYFDHEAAQRAADALLAHQRSRGYSAITDGSALAGVLTQQIHDVTQDPHLIVEYSANVLPARPPAPPPAAIEQYHDALRQNNCTFEKVEILPHNIGYLKLNSFPETSVCRSTALAAMERLNQADAVIFDLRDNGGGYPDMVALIASWLFDRPVDWYDPRDNANATSPRLSPAPESRLADKPVYVLTSRTTISGAEQFTYNLKMLLRATLVGETTHGSAHLGRFFRLDDHFGMGIPETRPVNPYGKPDWEGIGVEPDVKVSAADALGAAEKLAENKIGQ
jgi:hypothetical protein